jgi:hypothetical protein
LVTELDIPAPIRPVLFYQDLQDYRLTPPPRNDFTGLYGSFDPSPLDPTISSNASFFIVLNGTPVEPAQNPNAPIPVFQPQITCAVLEPWPATQPAGRVVAVDVAKGRMAIGTGFGVTGPVDVFFHYGFSCDMGGGPYDRKKWMVRHDLNPAPKIYHVQEGAAAPVFSTLNAAIAQWVIDARPDAIISILDSRNYPLPNSITLRNEGWLAIEANTGQRPLLQTQATGLKIRVLAPATPGDPDRSSSLTLSGVVVEGFLDVVGDLGRLRLLHSTLVPGRRMKEDGTPTGSDPSIVVQQTTVTGAEINTELRIAVAYTILGRLAVPSNVTGIWILDSIVDGVGGNAIGPPAGSTFGTYAGPLTAERSTFFGAVQVKLLHASEVIFTALVDAQRTQEGCVRFSYVRPGSHVPRRYRCQPDMEVERELVEAFRRNPLLTVAEQMEITSVIQNWLVPSFTAHNYGSPFYAQLHLGCPVQVRTGAEDGSEMGVFSQVKQAQRESNLKIRLQEYLPFGLEAGIIYQT